MGEIRPLETMFVAKGNGPNPPVELIPRHAADYKTAILKSGLKEINTPSKPALKGVGEKSDTYNDRCSKNEQRNMEPYR